ncbi:MAG: hypothetical protein JEY96_19380 [Bacteroidales bacterium]|nr:hypothetical protein [Bacteroidales bacterium]
MKKISFLIIGFLFGLANSYSQDQITFPFVNFDLNANPRTQLNPMSIKLFDDYNSYRPSVASAPGNNSFGTLLAIYGRSDHWEQNLYFGADKKIYYRMCGYVSWTAEDGTVGGYNEWRTLLDSKSNIESNGLLKLTGNGNHYLSQGNLGIGTVSPTASASGKILHLVTSGDNFPFFRIERINGVSKTNRAWETFISSNGSYYLRDATAVTDPFIIQSEAPTNSFNMSGNGNIGIGTGNPIDGKLHIYKNATMGAFGAITEANAGIRIQDNSANMYIDGNTIYVNSTMALGTMTNNHLSFGTNNTERIRINANGNVGIGTTETGTHKLAVEGTIGAREIKVEAFPGWSDFVFNETYDLKDLEEVENFIDENKHLPDIPSEKEVLENGIELGKMDAKLLQKIEELTLYMIEQNKKTEKLINKVEILETENIKLKEEISNIKETIE